LTVRGGAVWFQDPAEIKQFDAPLASVGHLQSQLPSVRGQTQTNWYAMTRERQMMQATGQTVVDHGKTSLSSLRDQSEEAAVPAQGW
tara:strand:- start:391 stop:651 length:261 start_codon:yes stop_codon:yes gene_type:complete